MKALWISLTLLLAAAGTALAQEPTRPNILWLTSEDMGPDLGCYGDRYATTPNLDALAKRGLRYTKAWSNAPVCAPARTTIISGMYPPSTGAEHMRSLVPMPRGTKMYPQYLREAGYYCTNNNKEDYNLEKPGTVWDESSARAHYRNRKPGQPFFAVFNFTVSHESQIRARPHQPIHDPALVRLPAYHPDTPEVRRDWAQYHDKVTEMDALAGKRLRELQEAGLAEDTIVFYYADHGAGMPRHKRWPYNSGLQVPFIVCFPQKWRHLAPPEYQPGGQTDRLISFVDLAPSVLSLVGLQPPSHMQGQAFLGKGIAPPRQYVFGFRGRMDERYDLVRSVHDGRYVYIRNYHPHRIYGQHLDYLFQMPTAQVWKRLYDEGKLRPPQTFFWERKPHEELYDLMQDPDEVKNLAAAPEHQGNLRRLRTALRKQMLEIRDVGLLPEGEMHRRAAGTTPYDLGHDRDKYPLERILNIADAAASGRQEHLPDLKRALRDPDSAVRYWAVMGLLIRGSEQVVPSATDLAGLLGDSCPEVRIVAAEALGRYGSEQQANHALDVLMELASPVKNGAYVAIEALNALDQIGPRAAGKVAAIKALPLKDPKAPERANSYVDRLVARFVELYSKK